MQPYKSLEAELSAAKEQLTALTAQVASLTAAQSAIPAHAERVLSMFKTMTAMTITPRDTASPASTSDTPMGVFDCVTVDPNSGDEIKFALDFFAVAGASSDASGSGAGLYASGCAVEYTPIQGADRLPAFLQDVITFDSSQCPMFLAKVSKRCIDWLPNIS